MFDQAMYTGTQQTFEEFAKTCIERAKSSYIENKLEVFPPRLFLAGITPKTCPVHGPSQFVVNLLEETFIDMKDEERRTHMFEVGKTLSESNVYALHLAILMKVRLKGKELDSLILVVGDSGTRWPARFYLADLPDNKQEDFNFSLEKMKAKTYFNPLLAGMLSTSKEVFMAVAMAQFSKHWDERVRTLSAASD